MAVKLETRGNTVTARLFGELDHHTAKPLREQIDEAVERQRPQQLQLDFGGVTFMDSSGIGLIMGRYRLMGVLGGRLRVCGADARVRQLMRLAGLDRLEIWEKEENNHAG